MRTVTAALLLLAASSVCRASDSNPQREAYEQSTFRLDGLVEHAHAGRISQAQLKRERRRVESGLARRLSQAPVEMKPGDMREVTVARAEMNQAVIRSQEFEFFGPEDRPEWGWYPSRMVQSTGSNLSVDQDGRSSYNVLK